MSQKVEDIKEKRQQIVDELVMYFVNKSHWPDITHFQISQEANIAVLDELERNQLLMRQDNGYVLSIGAMRESQHWHLINRILERMFPVLREMYKQSPKASWSLTSVSERIRPELDINEIRLGINFFNRLGILGGHVPNPTGEIANFTLSQNILRSRTIAELLQSHHESTKTLDLLERPQSIDSHIGILASAESVGIDFAQLRDHDWWREIEVAHGMSRTKFLSRIRFVKHSFKKKVICRDVAQAFGCLELGFYKPAVILAGSVIEELLRIYLQFHNLHTKSDRFAGYIKTCQENKLLKSATAHLSGAARDFRNLVHLEKEITARHTISRSTAMSTVSAIFIVINDIDLAPITSGK